VVVVVVTVLVVGIVFVHVRQFIHCFCRFATGCTRLGACGSDYSIEKKKEKRSCELTNNRNDQTSHNAKSLRLTVATQPARQQLLRIHVEIAVGDVPQAAHDGRTAGRQISVEGGAAMNE